MKKITHVLDTSALIAHYQEEPGYDLVEQLVASDSNLARVSSLTWLEFRLKLEQFCESELERQSTLESYNSILGEGLPVDDMVAARAHALRQSANRRLPSIDALIAATAAEHDAILVHRDPHMASIQDSIVLQLVLPDREP